MKIPKQTTPANSEFVMQLRREMILDAFRLGFGFQVRNAERERAIEDIIMAEYRNELERAMSDYENGAIRFEFASNDPLEQHGTLIVKDKLFSI